ncbi:MAG: DNA-binding response regulator [Candidatus Gottesmanbacteria bacterium GW2011_GWC2_39_8]|uniref:DNA-binding response regulator n=1 Tax=Candidatus Gottesmanbacteria bacterium GW2011_GWC2_39_8 TaxID=1618450 RepID=A0A0G0T0V3_9BACT|nr:MAG: DNA-binding response regulator [Candidatus Gottesmanbacteria bacterium GW2011_GWC2_39_8]
MRILIIEDDTVIAENLRTLLKKDSFSVDISGKFEDGYHKVVDEDYDLIIIDWMLGSDSGLDLLKKIREEHINVPVLMLTAKSTVEDKVAGLEYGADDYLTKPFSFDELKARVKTLLRRKDKILTNAVLEIGDLKINTNSNEVFRKNRKINLSPREYSLLHYLAVNSGIAIDRISILSHVWDEQADLFSNTVDVHINYLRKKIDEGYHKKLIRTVKGKGYMLCA